MAVRAGCQGLELRTLAGTPVTPDLSAAERRRIQELCAEAGIEICVVGSDCKLANPNQMARRAEIARAAGFVDLADGWGAAVVRVFGGRFEQSPPEPAVDDLLAAALREVAQQADEYGIQIALETHDAFSSGVRVGRILEKAAHPGAAALWDLGHPFRAGEPVQQTWDAIGAYVAHVHFKDVRRVPGMQDWEPVLAGRGDLPLDDMIGRLAQGDYYGYVSVEWERRVDPVADDPAAALPQHTQVIRELLARHGG
ncbi:MAG: sugar phosphate isomerase/epimerase [Actinobacteria bacterium]|nr:sugar phosphate isomerase/epimerase [Actinomycetota bacterium]